MDFPFARPMRPMISTTSPEAQGHMLAGAKGGSGSGSAWPSANRAIFVPFTTPAPFLVRKVFWLNGSAVSGNADFGLYTRDGTRLMSTGSTAQSGTTTYQTVDVTDLLLLPGAYYMAFALDNATGQLYRINPNTAALNQLMGSALQNSAFPLPATATLATVSGGSASAPLIGITSRTVV